MATPSPAELNALYEFEEIDIGLIDEPANAERETMDPEALAELSISIQEVGLLKPLVVKRVGVRFEVIAGHRRLMACQIAEYSPVPCRIRNSDAGGDLAALVHENAHTEAVNPVEEARFYNRVLIELCGNDVDVLCIKVKRKRGFVEDRLLILYGYPAVVDALAANRISFAVARELNKIKDPNRALILIDQAVQMGATARQVMEWRKHYADAPAIMLPPEDAEAAAAATSAILAEHAPECFFCHDTFEPHTMKLVYIHGLCQRHLERMTQGAAPAEGGS